MAQALRTGEHLCRVMGNDDCSPDLWVQFYVSPYAHTRSMPCEFRRRFLKKMIIDVREES
ncbi:Phosphoglycerate mutase-like protein AT74 [Glycine max]|nr:Phosphoglycerate mutase-like protein AT74 [Glycine max]